MIAGVRSGYRALFLITISAGLLLLGLDAFGAFGLKQVTLDGSIIPLEDSKALGFAPESSVFQQQLGVTANLMCRRVGIGAARVSVISAHTIAIQTNHFDTEFLVYDAQNKSLRGLTSELVVAPLDTDRNLEAAILFIGISGITLFERPADFRLESVVADLAILRERDQELFSTISAVDCSQPAYLTVSFRNTKVSLMTEALTIAESIVRFQAVMAGAPDITQNPSVVDMRFDGLMIIPSKSESEKRRAIRNSHG